MIPIEDTSSVPKIVAFLVDHSPNDATALCIGTGKRRYKSTKAVPTFIKTN